MTTIFTLTDFIIIPLVTIYTELFTVSFIPMWFTLKLAYDPNLTHLTHI